MKALGLVVSDEKFRENSILKNFLTLWPSYATNRYLMNNLGREPLRDHFKFLHVAIQENVFDVFLI